MDLTPREAALLRELGANQGKPVSQPDLLNRVWKKRHVTPHAIEVRVDQLRDKLGRAGGQIRTVRGEGYMLSDEPESAPSKRTRGT